MNPDYRLLQKQLEELLDPKHYVFSNLSQFVACIYQQLPDLNWLGFYINQKEDLWLGPFQGKVACVRIPFGQGVCGMAAQMKQTLRVEDVDLFEGHIACDSRSRSELVIPLIYQDKVLGVLDMDSPKFARFSVQDQESMQNLVQILLDKTNWSQLV